MPNYGSFGLDNTRFRQDIEEARAALNGIGRSAQQNANDMDSAFKKAGQMAAGYFSIQAAAGFVSQMVQVRGEFQKLEVGFSTMLGSKEKSNQLMAQMVDLAAKTPFTLQQVAGGAKQLLAYQVAQEDINGTLMRLGNIAAGLGVPMERLIMVYGQVKAKGKLMGDDLRQFTEAGVPMIHELAKSMGVADGEVQKLISSGKVGFPQVQKVIENLTGAGGMFYNLMEAQSKTVTGQLSNLEDAWSKMLNSIGAESEGMIYGAIGGVSSLITNYETVGKVLAVLIATYGTYKAAMMAVGVSQALEAGLTGTQIALNLGKVTSLASSTVAAQANTVATIEQASAQTALNVAMAANPYIFIATATLAIVGTMWALQDSTTSQEQAQKRLNDTTDAAAKKKGELTNKTQTLSGTINSQTSTILAQVTAFKELQDKYPEILANLDLQTFKALGATEQQKLLNEAIEAQSAKADDKTMSDAKNAVSTAKENAQPFNQGVIAGINDAALNMVGLNLLFDTNQALAEKEVETAELYVKKLEEQKAQKEESIRLAEIEKLPLAERLVIYEQQKVALEKQRDTLKSTADAGYLADEKAKGLKGEMSLIMGYKEAPKMWTATDYIIGGINDKLKIQQGLIDKLKDPKNTKAKADWNKDDWEKEKKTAQDAFDLTTKNSNAKDRAAAKARIDAASEALKFWDATDKANKKDLSEAQKLAKEKARIAREEAEAKINSARKVIDTNAQIEQDGINRMEAGYSRDLAQLVLNHKRKEEEIKRNGENELKIYQKLSDDIWLLTAPKNKKRVVIGKNPNTATLPSDSIVANTAASTSNDANLVNGKKLMYDKLIQSYEDYSAKLAKIEKKAIDDAAALKATDLTLKDDKGNFLFKKEDIDKALAQLKIDTKKSLKDLKAEALQDDANGKGLLDLYLFGDGTTFINAKVKEIIPTFESFADLTTTQLDTVNEAMQKFEFTPEQLASLKAANVDMVQLGIAIDSAKKKTTELTDIEKWNKLSGAISQIAGSLGQLGSAMSQSGGTIGEIGTSISALSGSATNVMSIMSEAKKGAGKMDIGSVAASGIQGIVDMYSMIAGQIAKNKQAQADWNDKIRETAHVISMAKIEAVAYKESNIFGVEDPYSKAVAGMKQYTTAMEEVQKLAMSLEGGSVQTGTKQVVSGANVATGAGAGAATGAAAGAIAGSFVPVIGTVIGGLIGAGIGALVGSGVGAVVKKTVPIMENLKSKYGSIYDAKTLELNPAIIADYGKLDASTKKLVDNWKEIKAKADAALKSMQDTFKSMAGDLGKNLSDSLVNAFKNGDLDAAMSDFHGKVGDMIANIMQQMIFAQAFQTGFDSMQAGMNESFGLNADGTIMNADELANAGKKVDGDITDDIDKWANGLGSSVDLYSKSAKEIDDKLKSMGYAGGLSGSASTTRTASAKGIESISQETGNELNGRFTAIQGHTFSINESVKVLAANSPKVLEVLMGIKGDTARLEAIESGIVLVNKGINLITDRGVKML